MHVRRTKAYENTEHSLCLLALSVLCWGFVRMSFVQNLGKNWIFIVDKRSYDTLVEALFVNSSINNTHGLSIFMVIVLGVNNTTLTSIQVL